MKRARVFSVFTVLLLVALLLLPTAAMARVKHHVKLSGYKSSYTLATGSTLSIKGHLIYGRDATWHSVHKAVVSLQRYDTTTHKWKTVKTAKANNDGRFRLTLTKAKAGRYRLRYNGCHHFYTQKFYFQVLRPTSTTTHPPAYSDCSTCHTSLHPAMPHVPDCNDCHQSVADWNSAHSNTYKDCAVCHESDRPTSKHFTNIDNDCSDCHNTTSWFDSTTHPVTFACYYCHEAPHTSYIKPPYADLYDCSLCHREAGVNWNFTHPERSWNIPCVACHDAPNGNHPQVDCQDCHSPDVPFINTPHPANPNCSDCHSLTSTSHHSNIAASCISVCHRGAEEIDTYRYHPSCVICHQSADPTVEGAIWGGNTDCSACHNPINHDFAHSITPRTDNCSKCHAGTTLLEVHGPQTGVTCATCHDSSNPVVSGAVMTGDMSCGTCHATTDHASLHATIVSPNCSGCHEGNVINLHISCEQCHSSADPDVVAAIASGNATCESCHGSNKHIDLHNTIVEVNCNDCHANSAIKLHVNCAQCHSSSDQIVKDAITNGGAVCSTCHGAGKHIDLHAGITSDFCQTCHTKTALELHTSCLQCHGSTDQTIVDAISAGGAKCETCHGGDYHDGLHDSINSQYCNSCHSDTTLNLHTGCAVCHDSTDPVVVGAISSGNANCETCHGADKHLDIHDTIVSPTCNSCHTLPVLTLHTGGCAVCHSNPDLNIQMVIANGNAVCEDCHGSKHVELHDGISSPFCSTCHTAPVLDVHANCVQCHQSTDATVISAINAGGAVCEDCHGADKHVDLHDTIVESNCNDCHNAPALQLHANCAQCHSSTDAVVQTAIESGTAICSTCHGSTKHMDLHTNIGSAFCDDCHVKPVLELHASCLQCHASSDQKVIDAISSGAASCESCHGADYHNGVHNNMESVSCTSCHAGTALELHDDCLVCHASTDQTVVDAIANGGASCETCHGTDKHFAAHLFISSAYCGSCHTGSSLELHLNCAQCHNSSDPDVIAAIASGNAVCEDCHGADKHLSLHDGIVSTNCNSCHTGSALSLHPTGCSECHRSSDQNVQDAIANGGAVCETCHGADKHVSLHDSIQSPPCAECHEGTVIGLHVEGCAECHSSTRTGVPEAIESGTAICDTCHPDRVAPHGYDPADHLSNETCLGTCHSAELRPAHNAEVNSTVTTCSGCHPTAATAVSPWDRSCSSCHSDFAAQHRPELHVGADTQYQDISLLGNGCSDYNAMTDGLNCHNISNVASLHADMPGHGCTVCHGDGKTPYTECGSCHVPGDIPTYTVPGTASADLFAYVYPATDDSISAGWTYTTTPAAQPRYAVVNSVYPPADTSRYITVTSITAGNVMFGFNPMSIPADAKIQDVRIYAKGKSANTTYPRKMQGILKIGGQTYLSSNLSNNLNTIWTAGAGTGFSTSPTRIDYSQDRQYGEMLWRNPRTGADWTPAQLNGTDPDNSLQAFGIQLTSSTATNNISLSQIYLKVTYYTVGPDVTNVTVGTHMYHANNIKYLHDPSDAPAGKKFIATNPAHGWYDALFYQDCYDFCHRGQAGPPVFSATQGKWMWFSVGGDPSDATAATRTLTLKSITLPTEPATLSFQTNYQMGTANVYVEVSTNEGTDWTTLTGDVGGDSKSNFTGSSAGWVPATYDLSAYAEQSIKLRFRYVNGTSTDAGWAFDNLSLNAGTNVIFSDDAETLKSDWTNHYWTRSMGAFSTY